jgi:pimeloyl-ACP methyl ester carboxylesterase
MVCRSRLSVIVIRGIELILDLAAVNRLGGCAMSVLHKPVPSSATADQKRSVGMAAFLHRHPLVSAVAALLIGIAATSAGAGIGIRYLQKTGLTLQTVVGLACLLIGLVLLGYALTAAWKLLHRWWRLVLVPAGLAVLGVVYASAMAVVVTVVPPTALGAATPADEGLPYEEVTFTTSDGVDLSAWFVPSRNGAAVVLKHGAGSTRTATVRHAGVLADHGYGVLLMDARGHGRSGGDGMDFGWYGDQDTSAAVTFLTRQEGVVPSKIGVVGLSMGGEEAIGAAGADPRIQAVVAEGATGRTAADNEDIRPEDYATVLERGLDWYAYGLMDLLTDASPPASLRDSIAASDGTEFLLVAAGTVEKEVLAARSMRTAKPQRVQVWAVPGSDHMQGLGTAPQDWERRVVGFLDDQLQPRP